MCLSIAVNRPHHVLATGEHLGFEWVVVRNFSGYRCGYVRVPVGHPWHGKHYDDVDARVHGGLTFAEPDLSCNKGGADDAHWLGFGCAHGGDAPDPQFEVNENVNLARMFLGDVGSRYGVVRTQEYVEAECRSLCEQASAAT